MILTLFGSSSGGQPSSHANGALPSAFNVLPHFASTTALRRIDTSACPSQATNNTAPRRSTGKVMNGVPAMTAAAKSRAMKVLYVPHWPEIRPAPTSGISSWTSHALTMLTSGSP